MSDSGKWAMTILMTVVLLIVSVPFYVTSKATSRSAALNMEQHGLLAK